MFTPAKHSMADAGALGAYLANFPETPGYLDFARFSPPSTAVASAVQNAWQASMTADGVDERAAVSAAVASASRVTGAPAERIALTGSTSLGLFHIAFGVPGGEVLLSDGEFPAHLYAWWRAAQSGRVHVRSLPGSLLDPVTPDRVADALRPETHAVAVSAVDFRTGFRADLAGIREVIGDRLLIVDAIQAAGAVDLSWPHADAVVAGGQKWLRAGWGTGMIVLSERAVDRLEPRLTGWSGVQHPARYDGSPHPVSGGAAPMSMTNDSAYAATAFAAALDLIAGTGISAIEARIATLVGALDGALRSSGRAVLSPERPEDRAGIVVVRAKGAPDVAARLRKAGIRVTAHDDDRIRISVHATTRPGDLERLIDLL